MFYQVLDTVHWVGCSPAKWDTIISWIPITEYLGLHMTQKHNQKGLAM